MNVTDSLLTRISQQPRLWNILRRIVENGFRGEKEVITRELNPLHDVGQRTFLDLGCGTGEFARCFPANHYVGVDLSVEYLRFAVHAYAGEFVASDGTRLPLPTHHFDAALVLGVLHHVPDEVAQEIIHEVYRVLRPGAIALIMEDIPPPNLWNVAGHAMHWLDRGGFIRNEAEYRAFFSTGFDVLRTYTMRSGICDYGVYVLRRLNHPTSANGHR